MQQSMTWWIRAFIISSAIRGLILGIKGFLTPAAMPIPLHLTPLNASFVAALYLAGTIGLILTLFVRIGLFLLALPNAAASLFPWTIPPMLAQLYSCFFIAFAVIAMLVAQENRPVLIRNFAITSFALMALILVASLLYVGRFSSGPATWIWFGSLLVGLVAWSIALIGYIPTLSRTAPVSTPIS